MTAKGLCVRNGERRQAIVLAAIGADQERTSTPGRFPNDAQLQCERTRAEMEDDTPVHIMLPPSAILFDDSLLSWGWGDDLLLDVHKPGHRP